MRQRCYEGVVIKRINFGEADRIIILLSRQDGKIRLLAKGVRKLTSRRAPHLEIFSHVVVSTYESSFLPYITEASAVCDLRNIRKDLRKIAIAYHLCEIVERILPEKEKNKEIFDLFLETLLILEKESSKVAIRQAVRLFVHNLLVRLGYLSLNKKITYSQLLFEIEAIIERPLKTLRLLTKLSRQLQ